MHFIANDLKEMLFQELLSLSDDPHASGAGTAVRETNRCFTVHG